MDEHRLTLFLAPLTASVVETMQMIDKNAGGILYITDDNGILRGCLTDGDIRRWIIRTGDLHAAASQMMNTAPRVLPEGQIREAEQFMKKECITSVPIVDERKKVCDVLLLKDFSEQTPYRKSSDALKKTPVIVMAGGKGTRLYPYTKILPKPLIPIGDIPILERILNRFCENGAEEFYITVNYKKEMIKSYFNELDPPYQIHFVEETIPLGTAGSIHLIPGRFEQPVIVTNCDILIDADYGKIMEHHRDSGNDMTIVSSLKNTVIPYGVLHSGENGVISSMEEKPHISYFINTGMYVVNPEHLKKIPADRVFHMTHLADLLMQEGAKVGMYPISEDSFLDMGQFEEMKRMEEKISKGT